MKSRRSSPRTARKSANCWRTAIPPSATKAWPRRVCPSGGEHAGALSCQDRGDLLHHAWHGRMRIDGETREVKAGDAIAILPGQRHKLWNTGQRDAAVAVLLRAGLRARRHHTSLNRELTWRRRALNCGHEIFDALGLAGGCDAGKWLRPFPSSPAQPAPTAPASAIRRPPLRPPR